MRSNFSRRGTEVEVAKLHIELWAKNLRHGLDLLRELGEEVGAFYGGRTTGKHAISLTESKSCLIHRMDPPNIPQGKGIGT